MADEPLSIKLETEKTTLAILKKLQALAAVEDTNPSTTLIAALAQALEAVQKVEQKVRPSTGVSVDAGRR